MSVYAALALFLPFFLVPFPARANLSKEKLQREIRVLQREIDLYKEHASYIVIDTVHNRLEIRRNEEVLRESVCATGSGKVLLNPGKADRWQFDTPRGLWRVLRKTTNPIWAKPLWAFVETEEQAPILPWEFQRLDLTTLGAYSLSLGDSYEIHGTLYPALLGRHITHGCIRLGDGDLSFVYETIQVGSKVYIY